MAHVVPNWIDCSSEHDRTVSGSLYRLKSIQLKSPTKNGRLRVLCNWTRLFFRWIEINSEFNEIHESSKTGQGKNWTQLFVRPALESSLPQSPSPYKGICRKILFVIYILLSSGFELICMPNTLENFKKPLINLLKFTAARVSLSFLEFSFKKNHWK